MGVFQMEFDQDLYFSGETFLCGEAEKECPPLDCVPCDWSSQQPSNCDNVECCGPAQVGGEPLEQVNDWCESEIPYYSLNLGEKSPIITHEAQETAYFRFFVPEEAYCIPFQIFIRPFYGVPIFYLSNLYAFPNAEASSWRKGRTPPNFGWAQNSFVVCPNAHQDYQLGTYSLAVFSWYSSSFYIEIVLSPQEYPLVPPPGRVPCADVPESELIDTLGGRDAPVYCLEDTETLFFDDGVNAAGSSVYYVLPVAAGCHQVSFAATQTRFGADTDLICIPKDISATVGGTGNSLIARLTTGDDRVTFSVCSENVSYVRCYSSFWVPGPVYIIFSTAAIPHQTPLTSSATTPAASISYQEGLSAMAVTVFGDRTAGRRCAGYFRGCYNWVVPAISDPLIFWPPPSDIPKIDTEGTNVYGNYFNATNAQPLEKTLIGVFALRAGTTDVIPRSRLSEASVALMSVTNNLGEPPQLPNNAFDVNEKTQASASQYLPTISLASFPIVNLADLCNETNYDNLQNVIDSELELILASDSLVTIEFHKYVLDILGAGIAGSSCLEAAIEAMGTSVENVTLVDQTFCRHGVDTQEYLDDPCCNTVLRVVDCCSPFSIVQEEEQYTSANTSTCGVPECAETYFEDLAHSLNHVQDLIQGCSSGVADIQEELATVTDRQLESVIRYCFNEVGLGDKFDGVDCVADSECEQWSGRCNLQTRKCVLGSTSEVEDDYLRCYISKMSPSLEEYLRLNILSPEPASQPRDSEAFFLGLKSAASVDDCISPTDTLDIFLRSRYVWFARNSCKAEVLGVPPDDLEAINELCPPGYCLGTACRQSTEQCFRFCEPLYVLESSSEDECTSSPTICPVSGLPNDECEGNYCVYCPGGDGEECQYVPGDQDFCENSVACELGDGHSVVFGLSEEECLAQSGYCSVDCPGESCRSLDGLFGACLVTVASENLCDDLNTFPGVESVWYEDTICVINAEDQATCDELSSTISIPATWETCESVETTSCDGSDVFQRYLKCFVDLWHTCTSQEECEGSGHCTDRPWTTLVRSSEHPIDVQFGSCFSAGSLVDGLFCFISTDRPGIGCRERAVLSSDDCPAFDIEDGRWWWRTWLTPAMSETECVNQNDARFGCQPPGPEKNLLWLDDEDCDCYGGFTTNAWEWTDGIWSTGVPRTLEWKEVKPIEKYQWTSSLSFELLQTWLEVNEEQRFAFLVKSEVICENGYVLFPLNSLVCDCFSGSDNETTGSGGAQCYGQTNTQEEELVGISGACSQEESFAKGPSSRVSFTLDSLRTGCTLVNLSFVSEAWFVVPPPRPSISFEFEDKPNKGIVLNQRSATVGVLRGDGSVLSFSALGNVDSFSICLLVSENQTDLSKYPIQDFGYSKEPVGTIYPLGLSINPTTEFTSEFWCGTINVVDVPVDGNNIRLFPIQRIEDYENKNDDYTSQQTRALMYTLGVCYCICFVLLSFYLVNFILDSSKGHMLGIISFLLVILCVFRIVFMFGYPNALFDGNELAEFVVFEIPTFLLFSVVITSIFFWKKLTTRKKFFGGDSNKLRGVIILGLVFVWALWVIVTIVYSEVILEEDGTSSCPGRVAPSYDDQEEDTRTLTIIYQSLIISVTFLLACLFCYYSYNLIVLSKNVSRSKRFVMVIGGVIVLSFFLRSILFIIILAVDFKSSIYMFITLMITEIFLLFFLQLQFNSSQIRMLLGGSSARSTLVSGQSTPTSSRINPSTMVDD
eukprot:CAMPEP_0201480978 /NCGR_PEP_ID=MMETSP0151_2-20130828/5324_1 /ASSEMBLY_ACC=CAM_ASM_000257 /TAXON_ID=200890 /ORGANISM="Paramoeba atlantica, Strain 621/1 / CCAP 1560/9" /LENGTH=1727 /DNA_ID=CAMNT_0047862983 /DNA_START=164 /DNA_END=5347 /DNA_ORIENTATION=+